MPCPPRGAGAVPSGGLCPTALSWPCPGPGRCTPRVSRRSHCHGGCRGLSFSPTSLPGRALPPLAPAGCRQGRPGQSVFPGSGQGAGGSSEPAFQGRTSQEEISVEETAWAHLESSAAAVKLSLPTEPASAAPRARPHAPAPRSSAPAARAEPCVGLSSQQELEVCEQLGACERISQAFGRRLGLRPGSAGGEQRRA